MISGFFPARKRLQHHAGLKHSPVAHDLDMNPTAQIIAPERVSVIVPGPDMLPPQGDEDIAGSQTEPMGRGGFSDRGNVQASHAPQSCGLAGHDAPAPFGQPVRFLVREGKE